MSQRTKERLIDAAITTIATLFLLLGSGAWGLKESTADHRTDIQRIESLQQRTFDAICDAATVKPRVCTETPK